MIVKHGDVYKLYTKDGKKLIGSFKTKEEALKRERQVLWFKNIGKGNKIK